MKRWRQRREKVRWYREVMQYGAEVQSVTAHSSEQLLVSSNLPPSTPYLPLYILHHIIFPSAFCHLAIWLWSSSNEDITCVFLYLHLSNEDTPGFFSRPCISLYDAKPDSGLFSFLHFFSWCPPTLCTVPVFIMTIMYCLMWHLHNHSHMTTYI